MQDLRERVNIALEGRYRLDEVLGRGGAAVVYRGYDFRHERPVAVKVLHPEICAVVGSARFLQEIKTAAKLSHPHILPVHDSGRLAVPDVAACDALLFYVMPVVDGGSMGQRLAQEGALPVREVVPVLHDVLDALQYAHERGVVHRDIKPDNVMVAGRHALVADFGVAKALSASTDGVPEVLGVALGTPTYMAPEQAAGDPEIDQRADIYAVGVLAYELLAGQPPFRDPSIRGMLSAHVARSPEPLRLHRKDVPPALERFVMRCLAKDPAERWQSAAEALAALEGPSDGERSDGAGGGS